MRIIEYPGQFDKERVGTLAQACGTYPFIIVALLRRNYTEEEIYSMIMEPEKYLHKPLLPNAIEAAELIKKAIIEDAGDIHIFADYDTDGITSGYVMSLAIRFFKNTLLPHPNYTFVVRYPQRSEGYGISMDFCEQMVHKVPHPSLIITVDNGITKQREIEYLTNNNIPVVVTDHHEVVPENLPSNCIIVNPCYNCQERSYLAGVGVAFEVIKALFQITPELDIKAILPALISSVALGTISDVMPQSAENLALTTLGLREIDNGLAPLLLTEMKKQEKGILPITTKDLGFNIIPKLNAAGRFNDVYLAAGAFFCNDANKINDYIDKLEAINKQRKEQSSAAREEIDKIHIKDDERMVFFHGVNYPVGVHGIIAGDMTKRFPAYPCVCYNVQDDGSGIKGSFRFKNDKIDLIAILNKLKQEGTLAYFAGHPTAGVLQINFDKIQSFKDHFARLFNEAADKVEQEEVVHFYDYHIQSFKQLKDELLAIVNIVPLSGDNQLVFYMDNLQITSIKTANSNPDHIQVTFKDKSGNTKKVWLWNFAPTYESMGRPKTVDILFHVEQDFMRTNRPSLTISITHMRKVE